MVLDVLVASSGGLPDAENARRHGIAVKTVRRWRRDYGRRGLSRAGVAPPTCPRCHDTPIDEGAYAELLGWYLGDGHLRRARRDVMELEIYHDARYASDNERLKQLMLQVKPGGRPHQRLKSGCLVTTVGWKHWTCLLPQHGPGRKHERVIRLEAWQRELVARHHGPFLRGLFHSDGSRVRNWARPRKDGARYEYARWMFVNRSEDILQLCAQSLDALSIAYRRPRVDCIAVSQRAAVAALDELIGDKR